MRHTTVTVLAALTLSLVGCAAVNSLKDATAFTSPEITNVVGEVWKIHTTRPVDVRPETVTDHLMDRAREHCERREMTMLPVRGNVTTDGRDGWMEFRCQQPLNYQPEYKGLSAIFSIDDEDDDKMSTGRK